ncbi:MAG: TusE/DsrC/DsvC family sulfur relay protein [Marinobacter sp.]|nr:TusE/DsrC/DsvC family sulfur relay protein [Marinobacter sp.]
MVTTTIPARDKDGFLLAPSSWTPDIAVAIAAEQGLNITDQHWEIILLLRDFYQQHDIAPPANRIFVKTVRDLLGDDKGNSIYLMQLFPGSPVKEACRIAGLPRPTNCL